MILIDKNYEALIREINQGNYKMLGILADWYEDRGNKLVTGLRRIIKEGVIPFDQKDPYWRGSNGTNIQGVYSWYNGYYKHPNDPERGFIPEKYFKKLTSRVGGAISTDYHSAWEAFLDLARIYSEETT